MSYNTFFESLPPDSCFSLSFTTTIFRSCFCNDQPVTGCSLAFVEEGATLIGFDVDDVCMEVTV